MVGKCCSSFIKQCKEAGNNRDSDLVRVGVSTGSESGVKIESLSV